MLESLRKRLGRRVPFYLLVVALVVLVVRNLSLQPEQVDVVFHLGAAREGLVGLQVRYQRGAEELRRVRFSYQHSRAPERQRHGVKLPEGDFELQIDLTYRGPVPTAIRRRVTRVDPKTVRMRRPLLVRGAGEVSVFIADGS